MSDTTRATRRDVGTPAADTGLGPAEQTEILAPGTEIASYTIVGVVGMGGMGVVYRARDERLRRDVALKLMRVRGAARATSKARLLREAQALARLSHPNVVPVYEVGSTSDGMFIAMQLVEGRTLRVWLRDSHADTSSVLEVFLAAGRGLEAAHAAGLVHRDFKPDNVLIADDGGVCVTDFGLARRAHELSSSSEHDAADSVLTLAHAKAVPVGRDRLDDLLTSADEVVGTPAYMAPEQVLVRPGPHAPSGALSDQYSFCIALYEGLYGKRPFRGVPPEDLTRRSSLPPAPAGSSVPRYLRRVLQRGLDPDPSRRFSSMRELLTAIESGPPRRWVALGGGIAAIAFAWVALVGSADRSVQCTDATERFEGVWDQSRREAAKTAVQTLDLPYGEAAWESISTSLDDYVAQWQASYVDACEATHVRGEQAERDLDATMACLSGLREEFITATDLLVEADAGIVENAPKMLAGLSPIEGCDEPVGPRYTDGDPKRAAEVRRVRGILAGANTMSNAGRLDEATELARQGLAAANATGIATLRAKAMARIGDVLKAAGRYDESEAYLRDAFFAAQAAEMDELAGHIAMQLIWVVGDKQARVDEGEEWARHARMALERFEAGPEMQASYEQNYASLLIRAGRYEEAEQHLKKALDLRREELGVERGGSVGYTINELGTVHRLQGDLEGAEARYQEAYELFEGILPPGHPNFGGLLLNLGNVAESRGDHELALTRYQRALEIWTPIYDEHHPYLAGLVNNTGTSLSSLGRYDEAAEYFERARVAWVERLGPDHPMVGTALTNLGQCAAEDNRWTEAGDLFRDALTVLEAKMPPDHPDLGYPLLGLGLSLVETGREQEAAEVLRRVLEIHEGRRLAPPNGPLARFGLARAMWKLGDDRSEAVALARQARLELDDADPREEKNRRTIDEWISSHDPVE